MNKLSTKEAATYLGISVSYLRNMRQGLHPYDGPKCHLSPRLAGMRGGQAYFYTINNLDEWKESRPKKSKEKKKKKYKQIGQKADEYYAYV